MQQTTRYLGDCHSLSGKATHLQTPTRAHSRGNLNYIKWSTAKDEDREVVTSLQSLPLGLFPCPFSILHAGATA